MRICVYAASSQHCNSQYHDAARHLGNLLAEAGHTLVYGGGAVGSMGALADGALVAGGEVIGVIPRFMVELEWAHTKISKLELVESMRERKHRLLADADAVVALPGGCGTLEELFEAITLKRLGLYANPIVLLNTRDYWTPLVAFLKDQVIDEGFMNPEHAGAWSIAQRPEDVLASIADAPRWNGQACDYSMVRPR